MAFYNVENLFDTIVDPDTNRILQEDFTPKGPKNWTSEKYFRKLDNIARVISDIGTELVPTGPAILGVSEVENKLVLEDLVKRPAIASRNYQIVHFQSQDERGVDVAFLYQPSRFKLISANHYPILLDEHDRTRDLVVMCGLLDGEKMYFMVDHWPSRGGGQKKSQPKRDSVASHDRSIIDSILAIEPDAKIIFMGDLNDDPIDESVTTFLNANGKLKKLKEGQLYNPMAEKYKKGIGTLGYNGTWNLFDQIILTQSFLGDDKSTYKFHKALVYNKKYLIQESGYYKGYPFRSFSGNDFIGGYSDHFPSYIYIIKENK
ncbi:MAG: endonuclease/exonuclease/phosphatase family protein [Bacteroidales bacterium]|nr:endonuclease/exonuclease/phosphatase family protein [Bacteroidales bacterium]